MSSCIAGIQYIPSIEYFAHWRHHGLITLEKHEHYRKRTWRNKTAILSPDNPLWLTVPLQKGKNQQMKIDDVLISYDVPWQKIHLNSFKTAYGKTAFFDEVLPGLEKLFQADYETLWNLNADFLTFIISLIGGNWSLNITKEFITAYAPDQLDLRNGVPCGTSALPFYRIPVYAQVQRIHKTHLPNLCILDPLCHLGPETSSYLVRYADKLYNKP